MCPGVTVKVRALQRLGSLKGSVFPDEHAA